MATDATGTPTSPDSIPKYDVDADAPSGLGFNAAMDAIQTAFNNHVDKPSSIASGEVPVWNGSAWVRSTTTNIGLTSMGSGTPAAGKYLDGTGAWTTLPTGGPTWTYASTPPGSPATGDIWVYRDADPDSTITWMFRYNSGNTTYDWEFIGGSSKIVEVTTDQATSSATYTDLATTGPSFTTPRAGVYRVAHGFRFGGTNPSKIIQSIKYSASEAADSESAGGTTGASKNTGDTAYRVLTLTVAASTAITTRYKSQDATSASAAYRWIEVTPVRVS